MEKVDSKCVGGEKVDSNNFKVYLKEAKHMENVQAIYFPLGSSGGKDLIAMDCWFSIDEVELLKGSGIPDENGKEIFDTDIIFVVDNKETNSGWWTNVSYHNGAFWADEETLLCTVAFRSRVVGNKYEGLIEEKV